MVGEMNRPQKSKLATNSIDSWIEVEFRKFDEEAQASVVTGPDRRQANTPTPLVAGVRGVAGSRVQPCMP